jgi:AraC-like DNA-binding protein
MISVVGDACGASLAHGLRCELHAQHGLVLLVGLEADVEVSDPCGRAVCGRVVAVPPDAVHRYASEGPMVGFLFDHHALPPAATFARLAQGRGGARRGRAAKGSPQAAPWVVDGAVAAASRGAIHAHRAELERDQVLQGIAGEVLAALGDGMPPRPDRRVARVLDALRDPSASRDAVVAGTGLGEAHLAALFARDVGVPIRTFRLWQRMVSAVVALRDMDATRAAHAAGFADLAHFSRTCRRMMGHSPSFMRAALRRPAR